ncbi:MAG: hypothetical protein QOI06_500 [Nocardioidaceae bacterium]|nr:hypothetical protein [Nocardioidaceae bacterium]
MRTETLPEHLWRSRQAAHEERVDGWTQPFLRRRSLGVANPVEDFLFTYYSYRPAELRRWHPGLGVRVTGPGAATFADFKGYVVTAAGAQVDPSLPLRRADQVRRVRRLVVSTAGRAPMLGCFGLHEWAMVYHQAPDELRHSSYPLRLGSAATDAVVDGHRVTCTHHDAFRVFTAEARPRNTVSPTRASQPEYEQPGCLHATMDCYKWAYHLAPFAPAELVADCFELAREVRVVDMRAAPYDLTSLGLAPIAIETPAGKAEYVDAQRGFAARASGLRARLVDVCDQALERSARLGCSGTSSAGGERKVRRPDDLLDGEEA